MNAPAPPSRSMGPPPSSAAMAPPPVALPQQQRDHHHQQQQQRQWQHQHQPQQQQRQQKQMNGAPAPSPSSLSMPPPPPPQHHYPRVQAHASQVEALRADTLKSFASRLGTQSLGSPSAPSGPAGAAALPVAQPTFAPGTAAALAAGRLGLPPDPKGAMAANSAASGTFGRIGGAAGPLGGATSAQPSSKPDLVRYLHRDDAAFTGGAIVSLPGLDLKGEDEDEEGGGHGTAAGLANVMPGLGTSARAAPAPGARGVAGGLAGAVMPPPPPQVLASGASGVRIPKMAASVFSDAAAGGGGPDAAASATLAGTARAQSAAAARAGAAGVGDVASANADAARLERAAARNLGRRTTWTRSSAPQAPPALLRSLSASFGSLVDSRVRAWTLLLLRHSLNSGDDASRSRLLALLATGASIDMMAVATTFSTLEMPPETRAQLEEDRRKKRGDNAAAEAKGMLPPRPRGPGEGGEEDRDMVLPLIFEAMVDVAIQGQQVTVNLRAPGTIAADFTDGAPLITFAQVTLDTNALVSSMVEQARLVVFKAVARATALPSANLPGSKSTSRGSLLTLAGSPEPAPLPQFNSALSLSQARKNSALSLSQAAAHHSASERKAHQSAQRLSDLLHGHKKVEVQEGDKVEGGHKHHHPDPSAHLHEEKHSLGKTRKNRSVTWNSPVEAPKSDTSNWPVAKRRKLAPPETVMKRSNKSFGKPDASLFESVRNATFSDFGHAHKHSIVPTFVNGRLQVPNANSQSPGMTLGGGVSPRAPIPGGGMSTGFGLSRGPVGRSMGNLSARNANASFGYGLSSRSPAGTGGGGGAGSSAASLFGLQRKPRNYGDISRNMERRGSNEGMGAGAGAGGAAGGASMPRTPTALESLLLSHTRANRGLGGSASRGGGLGGLGGLGRIGGYGR